MKKLFAYAFCGALLLTGCSKNSDVATTTPVTPPSGNQDEEISDNVRNRFGVTFAKDHTWSTTTAGKVTVNADASVKKVQVLALISEGTDEFGLPVTSMNVLNEEELAGKTSVDLCYDAPTKNEGLYVAFVSDKDYKLRKINGSTVSLSSAANARAHRALPAGVTLPTAELKITKAVESWASQRGWIPGELLYEMDDYTSQIISVSNYSDEEQTSLRNMVFSYFKNGRQYYNLPLVKNSGMYNDKSYPLTTGSDPIIISPIYKCDGATKYGNEVWNSDLYYYYFKEADINAQSDPVAYLQSLPKYKAIPFNQHFGSTEDNVLEKRASYALVYWGDNTPVVGETTGSYQFPEGYKIGFMVRAKSDTESGKKQGEVYMDGRLNNMINSDKTHNFSSSNLGTDGPRVAWLTLEGKQLMCWESGTDADFNDILIEVEGGVEDITVIPEPDTQVYTMCFEDTPLGDYDLNDVVIKVERLGTYKVRYGITACGAWDELYIKGINSGKVKDDVEVHSLFGLTTTEQFVNTVNGSKTYDVVWVEKSVDRSFSIADPNTLPYVYNKTKDVTIYISKQGEDPHGLIIPDDFYYPTEKTCIKDAYLQFNNWGVNPVLSTDWYKTFVSGKVFGE